MMKTQSSTTLSFALMCALVGFPILSETIYTPSLPSIAESLSTSAEYVEWTLSVYFIGFAIGVACWGYLADRMGRRPVMLIGLIIYTLASFACWHVSTISQLLILRVLQAFGASVGSVITQTMLRDVLSNEERGKWFSLMGIPLALAPALGPLCGGWLDFLFNWRSNFVALFIIGAILTIICIKSLPETRPKQTTIHTHRTKQLLWQLLTDRKVMGAAIMIGIINGILFGFYGEAPFILIEMMGLSANQYGWVGLSVGLAGLVGSLLSHRLLTIIQSRTIIGIGCALMLLGSLALVTLSYSGYMTAETPILGVGLFLLFMFIIVLGSVGLSMPNILSSALSGYVHAMGRAGSIFGCLYYILIAAFIFLMAKLHNGTVVVMPWYFLVLSLIMIVVFYWQNKTKQKYEYPVVV